MKFLSLAALKVVKMTTRNAASDENVVQMIFFVSACKAALVSSPALFHVGFHCLAFLPRWASLEHVPAGSQIDGISSACSM